MSWGCPHDADGECQRVPGKRCEPGMKGCILFGRFVFSDEGKNRPGGPRRRESRNEGPPGRDRK